MITLSIEDLKKNWENNDRAAAKRSSRAVVQGFKR